MADVHLFLKMDGVPGETNDLKHKGEIDLESFSWGETNQGTAAAGGGGGAGKVSMQDFHFVTRVNKASPVLLLSCASGKHIKEAILTVRKAGKDQQDYLVFKFKDVLVSSYQIGGAEAGGVPTEQVSFNFTKVEIGYAPQKKDGQLDAMKWKGYDVKKNQKV